MLAQSVGIDGFALLDALDSDEAPEGLRDLPVIDTLAFLHELGQHPATRATARTPLIHRTRNPASRYGTPNNACGVVRRCKHRLRAGAGC